MSPIPRINGESVCVHKPISCFLVSFRVNNLYNRQNELDTIPPAPTPRTWQTMIKFCTSNMTLVKRTRDVTTLTAVLLYKQGSFMTEILSTALAVHCGALWQMLMSSLVVSHGTSVLSYCTYTHCTYCQLYLWASAFHHAVLTSDLLYFLRYHLTEKK